MIFRIVQIDEIDIVVVAIGSCNGPNRQRTLLAAKTGKDFLLLRNIPNDIGTFVRGMVNFATSEASSIQFCHYEIFSRFDGRVIVKRFCGSFDSANIAITRGSTSVARTLRTPATICATIGTAKAIMGIATSRSSRESSHCVGTA